MGYGSKIEKEKDMRKLFGPLAILVLPVLFLALGMFASTAVAGDDDDKDKDKDSDTKITICHKPDSENETKQIDEDDWPGDHRSHDSEDGVDYLGSCTVVTYTICHRTVSGYTKMKDLTQAEYDAHVAQDVTDGNTLDIISDECPSTSIVPSGASPASGATSITGASGGQGKTIGSSHSVKPRAKKR